jgi:hypothetical protein
VARAAPAGQRRPFDARLDDELERARLRKVFEQGLAKVVGYMLPLKPGQDAPGLGGPRWITGPWFLRTERMYLMPGDSPMGYRLPLDSLPWVSKGDYPYLIDADPFAPARPLPAAAALRAQYGAHAVPGGASPAGGAPVAGPAGDLARRADDGREGHGGWAGAALGAAAWSERAPASGRRTAAAARARGRASAAPRWRPARCARRSASSRRPGPRGPRCAWRRARAWCTSSCRRWSGWTTTSTCSRRWSRPPPRST